MTTAELAALSFTYSSEGKIRTSTVGATLGGEAFVGRMAAAGKMHCQNRASGWWDANELELCAAYTTLAAAL